MLIRAKINCINVTVARHRLIHREVLRFPVSGIAQICRSATLPFDEFLEMGSGILRNKLLAVYVDRSLS